MKTVDYFFFSFHAAVLTFSLTLLAHQLSLIQSELAKGNSIKTTQCRPEPNNQQLLPPHTEFPAIPVPSKPHKTQP
jgi:hypothetical protein